MATQDALSRWRQAYGVIYFVGGLSMALGLAGALLQIELLQNLGFGIPAVIFGLVYLGLGYLVQAKKSAIALGIAMVLYVADAILGMVAVVEAGGRPTAGIALRVVFLVFMYKGFGAIKELNAGPAPEEGFKGTDSN